jgi:diguanylate cyclase (GGDEF)-like protein/PAS domain S-box-containing protein
MPQTTNHPTKARSLSSRSLRAHLPGPRGAVVAIAACLVLGLAIAVAETVASHVTDTAVDEAVKSVETIVRGDVDDLLSAAAMADPGTQAAATINARLERLTGPGHLLRVKVWRPDGAIVYSDLPVLRGRQFPVSDELDEAFQGQTGSELTTPDAAENVFEQGLADRVLEVYLPLRDPQTNELIGAYEVYQDAATIDGNIAATRNDALLLVAITGAALLLLLVLGFSGTSRMLARQNRLLRDKTAAQEVLAADLGRSEERFRSLVHNSADIIAVLDVDGLVRYVSPAVERLLGASPAELVGSPFADLVHPDDMERANMLLAGIPGATRAQASSELRLHHRDGSWRVIDAVATDRLRDLAVAGIVLNAHDVTDRKRLEEQLTHQAFHDSLTGLANRALFVDRVTHALARNREGHPIALLFLDLDDFKSVNDLRGHTVGDRLLVAVGERVRTAVREMDSVARIGGDEFAILVEDAADRHAPVDVAQRILEALRVPLRVAADDTGQLSEELSIRASIGVAVSSQWETADQLLSDADIAMYLAKGAGGDRFALFDAVMSASAVERLSLKADLAGALNRGELSLAYQPIVDLHTGRTIKIEALLRWQHPERGPIPPSTFIPLAEQSGVIVELGRWVLAQACRHLVDLGPEADDIAISVNVSGRQLGDEDLVEFVRQTLADSGLPPERLILEMTESVLIRDLESGVRMMTRLRGFGVRLAIDDFGTGYSSLSYLSRFPVDFLKIDRAFVATLAQADPDSNLVRTIVEMGRTLGLVTIAEGIEAPEQLARLQSLGATLGQGFLLARPMSFERLRWYLRGTVQLPRSLTPVPRPAELAVPSDAAVPSEGRPNVRPG